MVRSYGNASDHGKVTLAYVTNFDVSENLLVERGVQGRVSQ